MEAWVLIWYLALWNDTVTSGSQEFTTKERCEVAAHGWLKLNGFGRQVKAHCFKK